MFVVNKQIQLYISYLPIKLDHLFLDVAENTTDAETPVDGPIASLVPAAYHKYISKSVLKSYVCSNEKEAQFLRKKMEPADIPVIVFNKFKPMYSGVSKNLSEFGLAATRDMKPWLVNLLVDWCSFDEVICKETVSANITGIISLHSLHLAILYRSVTIVCILSFLHSPLTNLFICMGFKSLSAIFLAISQHSFFSGEEARESGENP